MPATYQTIIDNGFAKSSAARANTVTSPAELVTRVNQCLLEAFQVMSRENPYLVGTSLQLLFSGTGWARPSNCMRAIIVKADSGTIAAPPITPGDEIAVVPYDDLLFCEGLPSLSELGQTFVPTGQTMDPSGGTLVLVYARTPVQATAVTDSVDALFPEALNDFLQYDIAAYLAMKDARTEDTQSFLASKSAILSQLIDWCRQQTYSLQQRFPAVTPPLTNTNAGRAQQAKGS